MNEVDGHLYESGLSWEKSERSKIERSKRFSIIQVLVLALESFKLKRKLGMCGGG